MAKREQIRLFEDRKVRIVWDEDRVQEIENPGNILIGGVEA